jgi:TPP-dependent pyruvate/acetoin dehydrogenase alpha subunit
MRLESLLGSSLAARAARDRLGHGRRSVEAPPANALPFFACSTRARHGDGPTLLECQTYRHYGHSKSDPAPYRPKDEVEQWLERDPLKIARARLLDDGLGEAEITAVEESVKGLMEHAVRRARAAPYPDSQTDAATEFCP